MSINIYPKTWSEKAKFGFTLFLFTTFVLFIDFISNVLRSNVGADMNWLSWFYYIPSAMGQASLFAFLLYIIFYLPFATIFRSSTIAVWIYIICAIILQMLVVLDGYVFAIYRFHLNGFVLELIMGAGSDIFVVDLWVYLKFFLHMLFIAIVPYIAVVWLSKRVWYMLKKKHVLIITIGLFLCIVVSHIGHALASAYHQLSIQKSSTAIPFFFPLTAYSLLNRLGLVRADDINSLNYNEVSYDIVYPLHPLVLNDSIPHYNIIYIAIDSWSSSACDSIATPNIYKLSQQGHFFEQHYSGGNGTRSGIFGLFFGLPHTYDKEFHLSQRSPLFIDQLIDRKYGIQTFPSADFTMPPFHETIFRRVPNINIDTEGEMPFERDTNINKQAIDYIDQQESDKPFFAFLFYDLPHAMTIPEQYRTKFQPSWAEADYMKLDNEMDRTPFFNLYKNCVYHVDKLIGEVLDKLEEKNMMQNTVIVITGDHGQEFNENNKNYWGHGSNFSDWQIKTPMVLYYPGMDNVGERYTHVTTHYDVSPTVMGRFLGVNNNTGDYSLGYDIYDNHSRYPHIIGGNVRFGFVFQDLIITTNHIGTLDITDRQLNPMSRKAIDIIQLQEAIEKKNRFYKK